MHGLIPEATLTELRERANIVEIVSAHVGLRKVGRNHLGLCPFHAEKTPSFTVNEDRAIFHCFGCGVGGNVFTFVMRMENLPFPDVVERLARRYGVTLPERATPDPTAKIRESLFRLNEHTARFFQRYLWESGEASPAREYLGARGIGRAVAERFLLGYAPAGGDALVRRLRAGGHALDAPVRLGLVGERRGGGTHYDRFRARLMFPIADSSGRVVGFGSRSVPGTASEDSELPKYLNSPETPLYRKGAHLYGLGLARDAIRGADCAVVVEGYFDVLALVEAGVGHAVASLGTALTLQQLHVLKRFTRNVVACFDGDAAGEKAAEKSLPTFLEAGLWGHAAFLPASDDPDTFVRREGRDAVLALLGRAQPLLDFYLDRAVSPASTPAERAHVAQLIAQLLAKIRDPFEYDITVRRAAERLGIAEELLRRPPLQVRAGGPTSAGGPATRDAAPAGAARATRPVAKSPGAEALLVELMLSDPAAAARVDAVDGLALFTDPEWRALAEEVVTALKRGAAIDPATLLARLDDVTAARITGRLLTDTGGQAATARVVDDCLARLREQALETESQILLRRIRDAAASGNDRAVEEGLREKLALDRRREALIRQFREAESLAGQSAVAKQDERP